MSRGIRAAGVSVKRALDIASKLGAAVGFTVVWVTTLLMIRGF